MIEFATLALEHVGMAVLHAVVHIAGDESFHSVKFRMHKRVMRNHDVTLALRESFLASLRMLQEQYSSSLERKQKRDAFLASLRMLQEQYSPSLEREHKREIKTAFDQLRSQIDQLFPLPAHRDFSTVDEAIELATDPEKIDNLADVLILGISRAPADLCSFLRDNFSVAFRFAFTEIGLKHNEVVRSVLMFDLMSSVQHSSADSAATLEKLRHQLEAALLKLDTQGQQISDERSLHENTNQTVENILSRVNEIADLQRNLIAISTRAAPNETSALAYVTISDKEGNRLANGKLLSRVITVGRDADNTVCLPYKTVGRKHLKVTLDQTSLTIEDLNTTNGTYLNGDRIASALTINYGDQIALGPYLIEFQCEAPEILESPISATAPEDHQKSIALDPVTSTDQPSSTNAEDHFPQQRSEAQGSGSRANESLR
jgi:pSer/pThr/pTyr-binding forkhead associated (FHA) protein